MKEKLQYFFISIFLVVGLVALFLSSKDLIRLNKYKNYFVKIKATYKEAINRGLSYKDGQTYITYYNFVYTYTVSGKSYEITTNYASNIVPKMGDTITIIYNSQNPNEVFIPRDFAMMFIFGLAFVLGSSSVFYLKIRNNRMRPITTL